MQLIQPATLTTMLVLLERGCGDCHHNKTVKKTLFHPPQFLASFVIIRSFFSSFHISSYVHCIYLSDRNLNEGILHMYRVSWLCGRSPRADLGFSGF